MASLGIIIVTYNSGRVIGACLDALGPWRKSAVVVDNASRDDSVGQIQARGVKLIRRKQNTGFAGGANCGAKNATGDVLCFLNPDCLPYDGLMRRGLEAADSAEPVAVSPYLHEENGYRLSGRQPGYTRLKLAWDILSAAYPIAWLGPRIKKLHAYDDPHWFWPHGACLFIRRGLFRELGGFDERLFAYMEDADLGYRLWRAGGRVIQLEQSISHQTASGSKVSLNRRRFLMARGRLLYASFHYGGLFASLLGAAALPGFLIKGLLK